MIGIIDDIIDRTIRDSLSTSEPWPDRVTPTHERDSDTQATLVELPSEDHINRA